MKGMEKQYLYHAVPEPMIENSLHPLNTLKNPQDLAIEDTVKEALKEAYATAVHKYENSEYRKTITEKGIPPLNCKWGDVLQFSPVHPQLLKDALKAQGFDPKEMKFYQIDPELLNSENTTIYLYNEDKDAPDVFAEYDPKNLEQYSQLTEETRNHYIEAKEKRERPFLFVGVPHIFHKGSLDVSNFPVITV